MSNAMTLFGNTSTNLSAMLSGFEDSLTGMLAGGGGGLRRLSIKGGVFREIVGGKEVRTSDERAMNVVFINAAPVSRNYYSSPYVEGEAPRPVCWSSDSRVPDADVPKDTKQAQRCMDCKQNIKGSGQGESRACRFQQRTAIMIEGEMDKREVYQLALPATSVFGDAENGKMPLQAYGRHLKAHNTPIIAIVTEIRFDTSSPTPKLVFKPVRPLTEAELKIALEMREDETTVKAISMLVPQVDGNMPEKAALAAPAPAPKPAPKAEPVKEEVKAAPVEEEVIEPKVSAKKTSAPVEEKADLDKMLAQWDD